MDVHLLRSLVSASSLQPFNVSARTAGAFPLPAAMCKGRRHFHPSQVTSASVLAPASSNASTTEAPCSASTIPHAVCKGGDTLSIPSPAFGSAPALSRARTRHNRLDGEAHATAFESMGIFALEAGTCTQATLAPFRSNWEHRVRVSCVEREQTGNKAGHRGLGKRDGQTDCTGKNAWNSGRAVRNYRTFHAIFQSCYLGVDRTRFRR